ncbi:MAG: hypothetical protein JOZ97_00940 [Candidatus Eremiobacteraeota bacterium]|nr:hypothetical protein [Candidatus Eremiobacteraeota bacterium]
MKVWIYRGEVLPEQARGEARGERTERATFRRERAPRAPRSRAASPRTTTVAEPAPSPTIDEIASAPSDVQQPPQSEEVLAAAQHEVDLAQEKPAEEKPGEGKPDFDDAGSQLHDPQVTPNTSPAPSEESSSPTQTSPQGDQQPSDPTQESTE